MALLLPGAARAQAAACVRTVAEFDAAYRLALLQPVTIRMAAGAWNMAGSTIAPHQANFVYPARSVRIEGGYNSSCTTRSEDPGATVLTGSALTLSAPLGEGHTLHIERLSFRELVRVEMSFAEGEVFLNRVWFDTVTDTRVNALRLTLRNSIVAYGGAGGSDSSGRCALDYFNHNPERVRVEHSSFVRNLGPAALCFRDYGGEQVTITSSVFWQNGLDIRAQNRSEYGGSTAMVLLNNVLGAGVETASPLAVPQIATQTGNPLFVSPDNFRLSTGSPALNSGRTDSSLLYDLDFAGNPRWQSSAPDRGAFEASLGVASPVLTVTNTNDSGAGSLRQALIDANAGPSLNTIRFNIPGACPRTITLASLLPTIAHPLAIEGYTQPGASRNTAVLGWNANLCIVLNGANQLTGAYGFNVDTAASPDATVSIEGIAFSGHSFAAAQFVGGRNHRFVGNQIGGVAGSTLLPSGTGVRVGGTVSGVRIGGPEPAERNVIASTLGIGINVSGSGSNQPVGALVQNNYIGTQTGGDVRGNERGVFVAGPDHVLRGNVIANASSHGVELAGALATGNRITGNRIGVPALCAGTCANRGNAGHGVFLRNSANNNLIDDNHIAYNALDGVAITGARGNTLRANASYAHGGIGIDLGDDGRNLFDANNAVAAPIAAGNDSQNAPVLSSVAGTAASALVAGSLNSANGWYRIDFYGSAAACSLVISGGLPAGFHGEGLHPLGSTFVQITNGSPFANGVGSFSGVEIRLAGSSNYFVAGSTWILATATRMSGPPLVLNQRYLGTSEFGRCRQFAEAALSDEIFANGFEGEQP